MTLVRLTNGQCWTCVPEFVIWNHSCRITLEVTWTPQISFKILPSRACCQYICSSSQDRGDAPKDIPMTTCKCFMTTYFLLMYIYADKCRSYHKPTTFSNGWVLKRTCSSPVICQYVWMGCHTNITATAEIDHEKCIPTNYSWWDYTVET